MGIHVPDSYGHCARAVPPPRRGGGGGALTGNCHSVLCWHRRSSLPQCPPWAFHSGAVSDGSALSQQHRTWRGMQYTCRKPLKRPTGCPRLGVKRSRVAKVRTADGKGPAIFGPAGSLPGLILSQVWVRCPGVWPRNQAQNLGTGADQDRKWIQHPRNRGAPCGRCQLAVGWVG